jgi:Flp pilus assembly protein TadG
MRISTSTGLLGWLDLGRKGTVAVWIAVMTPGLIMATAMAVEVGSWMAAEVGLQRAADASAIAGLTNYKSTQNAQTAATFAARMAQLNGGTGQAATSWVGSCSTSCTSKCTDTLTDNQITATVTFCGGWASNADIMMTVTVNKTLPSYVSTLFNSMTSHTVTASGTAELVTTTSSFPGNGTGYPCMLALSSSGTISGAGSTYWTMPNCTVRSNGSVDVHGGGGPLTTDGIYAAGSVNIDSWISTPPNAATIEHSYAGTFTDPFANYAPLQNAITTAASLTGQTSITCGTMSWTGNSGTNGGNPGNNNCNGTNVLPNGGSCTGTGSVTCTLYPGNYGSWLVTQGGPYTFNLQPGLYLFSGPILLTNNTTTNGTGVTIITNGGTYNGTAYSFVGSNTFNFNVSAPTGAQVVANGGNGTKNAGVAGIALASTSSNTATLSGNEAFAVSGVVYFPNAIWDASGTSCNSSSQCMGTSSTACLELIAQSIKTSGYVTFNSQCSSYGISTQNAAVTH